ncbi:MAG: lipid-binding SYLF domain-containing protein [Gammaproteobacteria bacterium]
MKAGTRTAVIVLELLALVVPGAALADWQPDPADKRQVRAAAAIDKFRASRPGIESYFDQAYGFAVLPSVTRAGLGFGGAYGRGLVIEQDSLIGTTGYWQFTSGIQAGAKNFIMLIFFRDAEALAAFKERRLQFMGQAGVSLATVGADATPTYNDGVAVFSLTNLGLMGELTVSGAKFTYRDLE